jgi:hypothetical protein
MDNKTIVTILTSEDVTPLDSECDIEDLILSIKGLDERMAWYKTLKDDRVAKITQEIEKLSNRKNRLKEVITATLKEKDKKTLNFPGVGKVSVKNLKGTWDIKDEYSLKVHLGKELDKDAFEKIVVTKESVSKAELKKVLEMWEKSGSLPVSVERTEDRQSLSVIIDKTFSDSQKMQDVLQSVDEINVEDMDELTI